uniref:Uncharacterized protein n=1 Tax=Lotus japonicus TaxID=34305 RepID=I3S8P3_LOTJA|nr:unknown [Lotus japonicus]
MESSRFCRLQICTMLMENPPTAWMSSILSMLLALTSTPLLSFKG